MIGFRNLQDSPKVNTFFFFCSGVARNFMTQSVNVEDTITGAMSSNPDLIHVL